MYFKSVNSICKWALLYRCECFNGLMKEQNQHTNHHAAIRDIATSFALCEQLHLCADGGDRDSLS